MKPNNSANSEGSVGNSFVFDEYARYYDLLYKDKDYQTEADYVAGLIRRFHPKAQSIIELGSGTGIHASLLAKQGFQVHGVERSPEMLARSRNLLEKCNGPEKDRMSFSQGDIRDIRLDQKFDAAISLFHVISYQTSNDDITESFQTAREHLKPGGIFIFDVWYGPAVLTDRPAVRVKRMANDEIEVTRLAEPAVHPNENRVDVDYHVFVREKATNIVKELHETHSMRYLFFPELLFFASQSAFELVASYNWMQDTGIGFHTWNACFMLRR